MGRLHHLELENFKSYSGKQVIGPFENFSAIVGPNGAGKSNMMDAISFVLGVQSRHLRSSNLKELIFRVDADSAPARRACVTLVYVVSANEIEGRKTGSEIHFSRSISTSGVSTYRLDSKEVTYEVYENVLQGIGVLVKARNFLVFQGDVESVASKSPAELTKLLEQISGADSLRDDYEELSRKKEEAEESTIFSMQKKKMYVTQRKEVKEQKDEADLFQRRQDELADLKTQHVLWQIWRVKMNIESHQTASETLREQLEETKSHEVDVEDSLQNGKKELARVSKLLSAAEKDLASRSKLLDAATPQLSETRAKLTSLNKRITDLSKSESKIEKDRVAQEESIDGLRADMASLEEAETELMAELDSVGGAALNLDQKKAEEYARLKEEMSSRMSSSRLEELTIEQELKSKQQRVERMETQEEAARAEVAANDKLIADYVDRNQKLKHAIADGEKERDELRRTSDSMSEAITTSQQRESTLQTELNEVALLLSNVGDDHRRGQQEEKMAGALEKMQRIYPGVHGKLVDLCKPIQRKYATAIATTAGKQMDAIVVETKQLVSECIQYLKDERAGTCIFLPLDNLVTKPVPGRLRNLDKYRLCIDLVECDDKFKTAVSYALGSTLVCDTLEEAQELCFDKGEKLKVVTLKGHIISKTGAMTGGTSSRDGASTDHWEKKEVEKLRDKKTDLENAIARNKQGCPSRQQLLDIETKLKTLQTRMQYSQADMKVADETLVQLRQQKTLKETDLCELRKEMEGLRKDVATLERKLKQIVQKTREVEVEVFGEFSKSVGVTNIREYEENTLKSHQELMKKRVAVSEQRASLSAQLAYELKRDFVGALQRIQGQITDARKQAAELQAEEQQLVEKEDQLRLAVRVASERVVSVTEERNKAAAEVKGVQGQRTAIVTDRAAIEKKLSGEEILVERQRGHLHEVLQRAQVDEIALPTVVVDVDDGKKKKTGSGSGSGSSAAARHPEGDDEASASAAALSAATDDTDDLRWTGSQARVRSEDSSDTGSSSREGGASRASRTSGSTHFSQADNPTVVRDERKAAIVDLSTMEKHRNMSKQQTTDAETDLSKRIASLIAELDTIQPNMHAAERFEGVVEKLRECERELDAARETAAEITSRFEDIKNQRQGLFQECYRHVSDALALIYKDLTRSSKHPLGGNAYLTLDNTDEPYLGGIRFTAMPPMKRFRDMDQLSGGEKTMAALALLFSIHSFRQAPFFVLDEVDAALDNVNVKKICNYIRQRSRDFQCVVISLKEMFFEHADILVGICKDVTSLSSKVLTLDLRQYDAAAPSATAAASSSSSSSAGRGGSGAAAVAAAPKPLLGSPFVVASPAGSRASSHTPSTTYSGASPSSSRRGGRTSVSSSSAAAVHAGHSHTGATPDTGSGKKKRKAGDVAAAGSVSESESSLPTGRARGGKLVPAAIEEEEEEQEGEEENDEEGEEAEEEK